jgi:hypothetical protein
MIPVTCGCGASYSLKDELQGKSVKCPKCAAVMTVGASAKGDGDDGHAPDVDDVFRRDKFLLRQQHFAISEKYAVWNEQGESIGFVERPAHLLKNLVAVFAGLAAWIATTVLCVGVAQALPKDVAPILILIGVFGGLFAMLAVTIALSAKRHVTIYRDDRKSEPLLKIFQDAKFQLLVATYTVADPKGVVLARLQKHYIYNIFRKRWYVLPENDERPIALALEDSLILSLLRRFLGPLFGLLRTNFIITKGDGERVIGEFNRKFTLLDRYVLDLSADRDHALDRRVALALGIMLDTGEKR